MKIPNPPFHQSTDGLLFSLLIGGDCLGYEEVLVEDGTVSALQVPEGAVYAVVVVDADITQANKTRVVRFKEISNTGDEPTATQGIPLGDLSIYEVKGKKNLENFRAIGIEAGKIHSLKVQYFG